MASDLKKMRVQLYDSEMNQIADRLVSQDTELRKGADEHHGPIKLEVCLFINEDIEQVITYIQQLSGKLPREVKVAKAKRLTGVESPGWRDSLYDEVTKADNQDNLIKTLRKEGFVFVTGEHLVDMGLANWSPDVPAYNLQWMIKLLKEAKNPMNNKYDPTFMVGFQLHGEKTNEVVVYLHGEFTTLEMIWKYSNRVTFKKTEMAKFPHYMVAEEREKFRVELYKLRKALASEEFTISDLKVSKFFRRWYKDVDFREKEEWAPIIDGSES